MFELYGWSYQETAENLFKQGFLGDQLALELGDWYANILFYRKHLARLESNSAKERAEKIAKNFANSKDLKARIFGIQCVPRSEKEIQLLTRVIKLETIFLNHSREVQYYFGDVNLKLVPAMYRN